jgi:polysaccharide export outer membrane protein
MRGKSFRGVYVLAGLILMGLSLSLAGCTTIKSKPLAEAGQLPPSQDTTEVRTSQPYVFDVGDQVTLKVTGFDEFSKTGIIDNSGEIFFPYLGRLKIAGKTVPQTQEMLTAKLKKYIVNPQVDLTTDVARQRVYVLGEVNNPGALIYRRPLTVTEALARANWFRHEANRSKVLLVRRADNRFHVYQIDATAVFKDGSLVPQAYLQPGDLVYVPPSVITNIARFMNNLQAILGPFMTAEQMVVLWPALRNAIRGTGAGLSISTPAVGTGTTQ